MGRFRYDVFKSDVHKDGIYLSYEEFLNDQPSIRDTTYSFNGQKALVTKENGVIKSFWGLRKNNQLFKFHKGHLIPISIKQRGLRLTNYLSDVQTKSDLVFAGSIVGRPIAGLVMDQTYEMLTVSNIPYMKKPPIATTIDIETGEFRCKSSCL